MKEFPYLCVHQLFETQVKVTPDAVAVTFEGKHITYHELNRQANLLAHYLQQHGVGPEVLVGICIERSLEMIVGVLGILKAGGAYVPLDPTYPLERLTFMVKNSQVPVLVTQQHLSTYFSTSDTEVVCLDTDAAVIEQQNDVDLPSVSFPDNLAYVIYTSGSTGQPKGVQIPHSAVVNFLTSMRDQPGLTADDTLFAVTTLSFDIAGLELFLPLIVGARVIIANRNVAGDGGALVEVLERFQPTVMQATPATWRILLAAGWQGNPQLKILCGGEVLPLDLARQLLSKAASLWNMYGPTETTIWSSVCKIELDDATISIGRPIANTQIYLLDTQLQPVSIGVPAELYIGGMGLARGYLGRPDLTAERFILHPFINESGARLYRTGDLGLYHPDGTIELIGRLDHQVKLRGFRIELGEVEVTLAQHALVQEAVVMVRENASGDKRLVAYVVPTAGKTLECSMLRRYLQELLPDYMVPSNFVMLEQLPLTPNSKLDRLALPEPMWSQNELHEYIAPDTHVQRVLTEIWCAVLGISRVGITDNFFTLGGHSLLAIQVVARVRDVLLVELPLRNLFEKPTIVELSSIVEDLQRNTADQQSFHIRPISRDIPLPLSYSQERIWFIQHLSPENTAYRFHATLRFKGLLNSLALERSLNEIVRRHEAFRTTFPAIDGVPIQLIQDAYTVVLPMLDLRSFPEDTREEIAQQMIREEFQKSFDLTQLPLIRWTLLVLSNEEYLLVHVEHHLLHDGWSFNVFLYELQELYNAFSRGQPSPLPELPVQFADFASWQRQWVQEAEAQAQLAYWKKQLAGSPPLLVLSTGRPRPEIQTFRGAVPRIELPLPLCQALRNLGRQEGVTLFMTLLAVFKVLLYRYSGQSDICVGSGVAARRWRETEGLVGMIINNIVLRTNLSENPSFQQFLQQVRNITLDGYMHQDIPFDKVVDALEPERNLSYNPLFQVMFSFHDAPLPTLDFSGLTTTLREVLSNGSAKFDINVIVIPRLEQRVGRKVSEEESGITMLWEYNTDLFDAHIISRLITHYQILLEGIVADPEQCIRDIPMLTQAELDQMLVAWNNNTVAYTSNKCAHQIFELQVEKTPGAVAAIFEDTHLSYYELNRRANQLAYHLQSLGVGLEVCVGVCIERSLETLIAFLAILKAGGVYVPLDPAYPKERLSFMFSNSQMSVLLTKKKWLSNFPQTETQTICLDTDWETFAHAPTANPVTEVGWQHLAYVIYTSGSTGAPKGVMIEHGGMLNHLYAKIADLQLTEADCIAQTASLCFDISIWQLLAALLVGGSVCIVNDEATHDPSQLWSSIGTRNISILEIVPSLLQVILEEQLHPTRPKTNLSSLRYLLLTGEALSAELCRRWFNIYPNTPLMNAYGPTECSDDVTHHLILQPPTGTLYAPIGRPIANTHIYVLDPSMQLVPIGVEGGLFVGGIGVGRGYLNDPVRTAEAFIPDPFAQHPGARLYKTGDLAYFTSDGELHFLGRVDHQIKLRGFRIELGEIEAILSRHTSVREAVVIAREGGNEQKYLVAYIVPHQGKGVTDNDLHTFLKEQLPTYMLPSAYVLLDALPLTPNGKVDRQALPTPDKYSTEQDDIYVEPRTPIEKTLADIWCDVLALEKASIHANFFEVGGHSLLAFQVIVRVRNAFQIKLPLRSIFENPTIASMAAALANDQ